MQARQGFTILCVSCFVGFASVQAWQAAHDTLGDFVDITAASGVHFQHVASHTSRKYLPETMGPGVALFDYDNDGRLDLAVLRYLQWDYDGDGHIDLFVANDSMPELLYHDKGDGTFEEKSLVSQVAVDEDGRTYAGMGVDFDDFNNDGRPDLVVGNLANQMYAVYEHAGHGTFNYTSEPMLLARNTGHGFVDVSAASGGILARSMGGPRAGYGRHRQPRPGRCRGFHQ